MDFRALSWETALTLAAMAPPCSDALFFVNLQSNTLKIMLSYV